jgi:hypothetical protein
VKAGSKKLPIADRRPKFSFFAHSIVLSKEIEEFAITNLPESLSLRLALAT